MSPRGTRTSLILTCLALLTSQGNTFAAKTPAVAPVAVAKLAVGSPAPSFAPTAWLKGDPLSTFEKDKLYLIEFWATWCGPCVGSIPHLNDLHNRFADKGLVIVGVNIWDKKPTAETFVQKQGDKMRYRVAFDEKATGQVTRDWVDAAGITGIPTTLVVRDGKIIWKCHPGDLNETRLKQLLAGKPVLPEWITAGSYKTVDQARKWKLENSYYQNPSNPDEQLKVIAEILADPNFYESEKLSYRILKCDILVRKKKDFPAALTVLNELASQYPDKFVKQVQLAERALTYTEETKVRDFALFAESCHNRADAIKIPPGFRDTVAEVIKATEATR